jgi:hypothetical protein
MTYGRLPVDDRGVAVNGLARLSGTLASNVASVGDRIEIPSPNDAPGFEAALRNPDNPRGFYPTSR